ncbi:hypothetical protein D3C86_1214150 [compost metagenome]
MWIKAAARSRYQIGGNLGLRIFGFCGLVILFHPVDELGARRPEIGAGRRSGIITIAGSGRPSVEIFLTGEGLPDQLRTHHGTTFFYQAAICLKGEDRLRETCHAQGIGKAGDGGGGEDEHQCGTKLFKHCLYSSGETERRNSEVNGLDADEGNDDAAEAIDDQIARQQRAGANRTIFNALQRQGDQRDDDERVEDDG